MIAGTNHIEIYCPKCGSYTGVYSELITLSPGSKRWLCVYCDTIWKIEVGFHETESEGKNETQAKK